jgi:hypothetical protein
MAVSDLGSLVDDGGDDEEPSEWLMCVDWKHVETPDCPTRTSAFGATLTESRKSKHQHYLSINIINTTPISYKHAKLVISVRLNNCRH